MYVIIESNLKRHCVCGIFDSFDLAVDAAKKMVGLERDHFIRMDIFHSDLNVMVEDAPIVAYVSWVKDEVTFTDMAKIRGTYNYG